MHSRWHRLARREHVRSKMGSRLFTIFLPSIPGLGSGYRHLQTRAKRRLVADGFDVQAFVELPDWVKRSLQQGRALATRAEKEESQHCKDMKT
jgi:hypothetical protein